MAATHSWLSRGSFFLNKVKPETFFFFIKVGNLNCSKVLFTRFVIVLPIEEEHDLISLADILSAPVALFT